ncbi:aldose 1-epimerase [Cryobacterium psychrotolerans]|uniref:Aldose 1-epimerase n=1 Tax=Cryobacterium psychrotolerans TaxID=386301 RepID=A0A1G9D760_9MICO|nr:aldose epimerase family protein [Cryobacterium psychrotolerans]TFD90302.1 galactose mutarotase [Cryobacterium psychrotolerans]SDK59752.1 aldose 1-epimerase [Cryobacterium psychrotolerans]
MNKELFGQLSDGREVHKVTLGNRSGASVEILTYGGVIRSLQVPDRDGHLKNVVLGFTGLDDYVSSSPYFGAIIGRYANRIAQGRFSIDGTSYQVSVNDSPSSLHGGHEGFDRKIWQVADIDDSSLTLHYVSCDGEEGYPGTLSIDVRYELTADNTLEVQYAATTDAPTIINLTNHSFFNLGGEGFGSALGHLAQLDAENFLPVGEDLLPTGEIRAVAGTEMDFRTARAIGERIRTGSRQIQISKGYDHNFLLNRSRIDGSGLAFAARFEEPKSGRTMEVWTTEPAVDFYTGNFLNGGLVGSGGNVYRQADAFAIEPERPSNAPNTPGFESAVLRPGELYQSTSQYRFGVAGI